MGDRSASLGHRNPLLLAVVAVSLAALAPASHGAAATMPCAGFSYAVVGPALLSDWIGADAIRLGAETAAIRSGCEEAPVRVDRSPTGEHVMRAMFTHCAIAGEAVSLWLRIPEDCAKIDGRIGILPQRHIRFFEATRVAEDDRAWPPPCACEPPPQAAACEEPSASECS